MITHLAFALLAAVLAQGQLAAPTSDNLAAAKALYASGAYEEALSRLSEANGDATAAEANQYRALCSLALGRTAEAERSLEELVARRPLFKMSEADVSPRLVSMFRTVRKRLLPAAVKDVYARAKTSFEQKQYSAASSQFKELLVLLGDEDMTDQASALGDLRLLGEGFLKLTEIELASAPKAADPAPPGPATPTGPPVPRIYSDADKDVKAPVDVVRPFPEWHPSNPLAKIARYRGLLRVIIDEQGQVESATVLISISDAYDPLLLAATRNWKFRPALKDGQPVKYVKLISVLLSPQ